MKDVISQQARPGPVHPPSGEPSPAGRAETPAAELLAAVSAIHRAARRAVRQSWQAQPLPPAQSELLRLTAHLPGLTVAEAAAELKLAPNTVSTLIGKLVGQGLIKRVPSRTDGRSVRLDVTAKARQRLAEWRDLRADLAGQALADLSGQDQAELAAAVPALLRLAEGIQARQGAPVP